MSQMRGSQDSVEDHRLISWTPRPHLPGIGATSAHQARAAPRSKIPTSLCTEVGIPTSLHTAVGIPTSLFCPKPITGPAREVREFVGPRRITPGVFFSTIHTPCRQSWRGHRIARKNPSPGQRRRSVSKAVLAGATDGVFHTPSRQSWRGHMIAPLNPGVGTGLLHSILARAQDCPGVFFLKTLGAQCCHSADILAANRIAPLNPGVGASVHRDALPDSPPGLPGQTMSARCYTALR